MPFGALVEVAREHEAPRRTEVERREIARAFAAPFASVETTVNRGTKPPRHIPACCHTSISSPVDALLEVRNEPPSDAHHHGPSRLGTDASVEPHQGRVDVLLVDVDPARATAKEQPATRVGTTNRWNQQ